ncbi:hypothetical protein ON010_g3254 [Phytophthora cinnamomi]|nr:hypothetical protein ON010_g3254 [Phytophthora cinnamomi]
MMDVLYIPGIDRRLRSVGKLAERGLSVEYQRSSRVIWGKTSAVALGNKAIVPTGENDMAETQGATNGLPTVGRGVKTWCGGYMKGKQTVKSFPSRSKTNTSRVLELVHMDVVGPMRTVSKEGAKYVLTFVDDYSRYVVTYFMKKKREVASKLIEFKAFYENQWGARLKSLRSDSGTEFVNKTITELCRRNGIMHQRTVPYSPQQNGVAERMNRAVMEKARSMLHDVFVSTEWCAEAVSTVVYLINRSANTERSDVTPYSHIDDAKRTKLEPKSFRCVFLGYVENAKGYRVYDMDASKDKVSRSAKLDEREVGGIYATHSPQHGMVIHVTKDGDAPTVQVETDRQPVEDEPMEAVEEPAQDVEMNETESEQVVLRLSPPERPATGLALTAYHPPPQAFQDDRLVFHPEPVRSRRSQESVFLLGNGLIAEAVMTYAGSITEATDLPETRWVFAKKRDENGRGIRYKARLVAKGFKQQYGVDFFETYSPVANMTSIRVVLAVCVADGYVMEQLDADTAFLNSDLTDRVYMEAPLEICNGDDNVCVLNKAIYGLKQAASAWNMTIHRVFLKNGFKSCCADHGYGEVHLGLEIDHDKTAGTLMIKQTRYIDDVVERFGQQNAKSANNPCVPGSKLTKTQSPGTIKERAEMRYFCLLHWTLLYDPLLRALESSWSSNMEAKGGPPDPGDSGGGYGHAKRTQEQPNQDGDPQDSDQAYQRQMQDALQACESVEETNQSQAEQQDQIDQKPAPTMYELDKKLRIANQENNSLPDKEKQDENIDSTTTLYFIISATRAARSTARKRTLPASPGGRIKKACIAFISWRCYNLRRQTSNGFAE